MTKKLTLFAALIAYLLLWVHLCFSQPVNPPSLDNVCNVGCTTDNQIASTYNSGSPFSISSTTLNTNLNADLLDGQHGSYYAAADSYLKLDQTTPQTVSGGMPLFDDGMKVKPDGAGNLIDFWYGSDEIAFITYSPTTFTIAPVEPGVQFNFGDLAHEAWFLASNVKIQSADDMEILGAGTGDLTTMVIHAKDALDDEYGTSYGGGSVVVHGGVAMGAYPAGVFAVVDAATSIPAGALADYGSYFHGPMYAAAQATFEDGFKAGAIGISYAFQVDGGGLGFTAEGNSVINAGDLLLTDNPSYVYFGDNGSDVPYGQIGHNATDLIINADNVAGAHGILFTADNFRSASGTFDLDNDHVTTTGSYTGDNLTLTNFTHTDGTGYYALTNSVPTVAASTGKAQFTTTYVPTTGNPADNANNIFTGSTDLRSLTPATSTSQYGNKFIAAYQAFDNNTGFINTNYTGTYFSTTINGNYTSGLRMATASLTAVQNDVSFTGNHGGFGINFFPIVDNITFSAYTTASHQIIGRNQTLTFSPSSADNVNQLLGFKSAINMNGTGIVAGLTAAFVGDILAAGTNSLANDSAVYKAYVSGSTSAWDTALASGKNLYMFWGQPGNGAPFSMTNQDTYVFYADLVNNARNAAFVSNGADGWMLSDSAAWKFGAGKDASITFDGNSLNIVANLITSTDDMELTAESYTLKTNADTDLVVNFAGTSNSGVLTYMEDEDRFDFTEPIKTGGYYSSDGTAGMTGTCADGTSLTVKDGLITGCS